MEKDLEKRITKRTIEETGLSNSEVKFYDLFCSETSLTNRIIMYDGVKRNIWEVINKSNSKKEPSTRMKLLIDKIYDHWLKKFTEKGLISVMFFRSASIFIAEQSYPVLNGYWSLDDPEFYIAYKEKGGVGWSGRIPSREFKEQKEQMLKQGYEFRTPGKV